MIFCGSAFFGANSTSKRAARIFWSACRNGKHAGSAAAQEVTRRRVQRRTKSTPQKITTKDSELCYPLPLAVGRRTARAGGANGDRGRARRAHRELRRAAPPVARRGSLVFGGLRGGP